LAATGGRQAPAAGIFGTRLRNGGGCAHFPDPFPPGPWGRGHRERKRVCGGRSYPLTRGSSVDPFHVLVCRTSRLNFTYIHRRVLRAAEAGEHLELQRLDEHHVLQPDRLGIGRRTDQQGLYFSPSTRLTDGKIGHFSIERTPSGLKPAPASSSVRRRVEG